MSIWNINVISNSSVLFATLLFLLLLPIEGFQNRCASRLSLLAENKRSITSICDTNDDEDGDLPLSKPSSVSSQLDQGKFNPFDYQQNKKSSRSVGSAPPRVDLRSLRMSSLTNDLLNSLGDEIEMRSILEENRDFLLDPLEVEDSMASSGSIYTPGMSRAERYRVYRKSVDERLESSKNEKAKAVLMAMRDFVVEFE